MESRLNIFPSPNSRALTEIGDARARDEHIFIRDIRVYVA